MRRVTKKIEPAQLLGFVGVALDNEDDHQRLTKAENFLLVGGSSETHEQMQETAIRFNEKLQATGKPLSETSLQEAMDILREVIDR